MAVKRYNGTSWDTVAGLGAQGAAATSSSITTWVKTASGGETSLTGSSDSSTTLAYTAGQEQLFINGVLQVRGSDYTATNGTSITGLTALTAGDIATVTTVNAFSVTGAVPLSTVTANGDLIVGTSSGAVGRLGIGSTDQVLKVSGGVPTWAAPSAPSFVGALASTRATQSIANNTFTAINLATEIYDTNGFHDNVTNNTRFTIPAGKAGTYLFFATGGTDFFTGGLGVRFAKNGTNFGTAFYNFSSPASGLFVGSLSTVINLAVGDYVELILIQNSGSSKAVAYSGSEDFTFMGCTYLGA
jgi:hypothetical protein